MAIIDRVGLFNGKRLRRCSTMARLYWPHLFLIANGFARIELDFDSIAFDFASFGASAPTGTEITNYFEEYEKNHLLFAYDADGQRWAQWDTRHSYLKNFKTVADKKSPSPPEPEYSRWLWEQHGDDWRAYHWDREAREDGADSDLETKVSQDLPNRSETVAENSPNPSSTGAQHLSLGVGVGGGVGIGDGVGKGGGQFSPPSVEPSELGEAPQDAMPAELVSGLLERLGVTINPTIFRAVTESIRVKAESDGTSAVGAANSILLKAALAKKQGMKKPWRFWFEDQDYDKKTKQEADNDFVTRNSEDAR
jgi:hypothetical protein